MNVSSVGSGSAAQIAHAASLKVMKETTDVARQQGDAAISLLQQAAEMAKTVGQEGRVDVVA